jgi:3-oxoacyl-[acyl-carrier protein] reductase
MNLGLEGKTALITAASGGIGRGIAEALADAGVRVAISGRNGAALEQVGAALAGRAGGRPVIVVGDVCAQGGPAQIAADAAATLGGRIVNISGALVAPKLNGAAPAKAALVSWSRTLSSELGPYGVTVNTIAPGRINSAQIQKLHPTEQSRADFIKQNIPAGYFGEPCDIGHLVAFLASPLARYINGAAIPVDGGAVRRV